MPTTALVPAKASPAMALKAARVAMRKVYDPNQPRNPAGSAGGGRWTDDPGAGQPHPFGPGQREARTISGLEWANKDLEHLTTTFGANSREATEAAASVNRLEAELLRQRGERRAIYERANPSTGPSNRNAFYTWQQKSQAAQAAQSAQRQLDQAHNNLSMHVVPPDPTRAKIADVALSASNLTRNISQILGALTSFGTSTSEEPSTMGRVAAVAAALTVMAGAINVASRARDAGTLMAAVTSANKAIRNLRTEMPYIATAVKAIDKPRVDAVLARATTSLRRLDTSIQQSRLASAAVQTATRAAFRATGGKIIPAPAYKPPVTTVLARPTVLRRS